MPRFGRFLGLMALAMCAGCTPQPAAGAPQALSYQLVINNGTATLLGRVLAPAVLLDPKALPLVTSAISASAQTLNEVPVSGAQVSFVDQTGKNKGTVLSVRTDASGQFELRNLPIGQSGFVQASFPDGSGAVRYLNAYARPDTASVCLEDSLVSTLIANAIANSGDAIPYFNMKGLSAVQTLLAQRLPGALTSADGIAQLLAALSALQAPQGPLSPTAMAFVNGLVQAPDVQKALNSATDAAVTIQFSLKDVGVNVASYPDQDATNHLMLGRSQVSWGISISAYQSVQFFLNNTKLADATSTGGIWSATLDTTQQADGAYVLSAIATPNDATLLPVSASTFVYLKNRLPVDGACAMP
jgi:hypothetical protein